MAIDTAAKRKSIAGIGFMPGMSMAPSDDPNIQWRQSAGYSYAGNLTSAFEDQRAAIIADLDEIGGGGQANGWNNKVRDGGVLLPQHVVRTSDEIVTITLPSIPLYNISSQERIQAAAPAAALVTSSIDVVGVPTFTIDAVTTGNINLLRGKTRGGLLLGGKL